MSTLRNPVGPKDKKVYVRRRLIVLAVLLAIIAVVVLIIVRPGSSGGARGAEDVNLPKDIAASEESEPAAEEGDVPACSEGQLTVTPAVNQESYAEGEQPQLSLSVENTGEEACSADLGTAGMSFEISSGEDQVWNSTHCQENPEQLAVILEPAEPLESEAIAWDRTRSSPETCDITREPVASGGASYHLRAVAAGVNSGETAQFLLY